MEITLDPVIERLGGIVVLFIALFLITVLVVCLFWLMSYTLQKMYEFQCWLTHRRYLSEGFKIYDVCLEHYAWKDDHWAVRYDNDEGDWRTQNVWTKNRLSWMKITNA